MEKWLRTDETQQAVLALQTVSDQLSRVSQNSHHWQWVVVGLHNALQGFMVLALRGTDDLNVLTDKCAAEWIAAHESGNGQYPEPKLDKFLNLYKKIKSDRMKMYGSSQPFKPSGTQSQSIKQLNRLRNEFVHFVPKGWSLETSGLPRIVDDSLNIISFLAFACGNLTWHDPIWEGQSKALVEQIKQDLVLIKKAYGG